jgi:hypothetical protein
MKKFKLLLLMFIIYNSSIFAAEETIIDYTTYQTKVTNQDIATAFSKNVNAYRKINRYYLCRYEIYQSRSDQNYAWRFRIIKNTYNWGTIFDLIFNVSNGYFVIKLSNTAFVSDGVDANQIESEFLFLDSIQREYNSFADQSIMTLKMNNDNYGDISRRALVYNSFY